MEGWLRACICYSSWLLHIVLYMQVLIDLDGAMVRRLNKVAPPQKRKRSEFIREAIRRALNERLEEDMDRAYRENPPRRAEPPFDPATWEHRPVRRRKRR